MAYKDKAKQKQASKEAMRRLRAKNKGEAISGQKQGLENAPGLTRMAKVKVEGVNLPVNPSVVNPPVNPEDVRPKPVRPKGSTTSQDSGKDSNSQAKQRHRAG